MEGIKIAGVGQHLSAHFVETELSCQCCGRLLIHPYLINKLEAFRQLAGKPVLVNSGYRCPAHNRAVGGETNSYHLKGMAADIQVPGVAVAELSRLAEQAGFGGIGVYQSQGFVHVDVRDYSARWRG
nr:D-Ala-D-Ala carboxypeptidase family metallohydrolase [Desulfotomaculum nigrificans]